MITLNSKDKQILSKVKAKAEWKDLSEVGFINNIVKSLGINNEKIGLKCASHIKQISKKGNTSIKEILKNCPSLRPKKRVSKEKKYVKNYFRGRGGRGQHDNKHVNTQPTKTNTERIIEAIGAQNRASAQAAAQFQIGQTQRLLTDTTQISPPHINREFQRPPEISQYKTLLPPQTIKNELTDDQKKQLGIVNWGHPNLDDTSISTERKQELKTLDRHRNARVDSYLRGIGGQYDMRMYNRTFPPPVAFDNNGNEINWNKYKVPTNIDIRPLSVRSEASVDKEYRDFMSDENLKDFLKKEKEKKPRPDYAVKTEEGLYEYFDRTGKKITAHFIVPEEFSETSSEAKANIELQAKEFYGSENDRFGLVKDLKDATPSEAADYLLKREEVFAPKTKDELLESLSGQAFTYKSNETKKDINQAIGEEKEILEEIKKMKKMLAPSKNQSTRESLSSKGSFKPADGMRQELIKNLAEQQEGEVHNKLHPSGMTRQSYYHSLESIREKLKAKANETKTRNELRDEELSRVKQEMGTFGATLKPTEEYLKTHSAAEVFQQKRIDDAEKALIAKRKQLALNDPPLFEEPSNLGDTMSEEGRPTLHYLQNHSMYQYLEQQKKDKEAVKAQNPDVLPEGAQFDSDGNIMYSHSAFSYL